MEKTLTEYIPFMGQGRFEELFLLAQRLKGKSILNINSTSVGGGVAEILTRMVPLLRQLEVDAQWDVIKGDGRFFRITKEMHNALHGVHIELCPEDFDYFLEINEENARNIPLDRDIIFIHDPQPIPLVEKRKGMANKWIWRCHIDFTTPLPSVMKFLQSYIELYDCAVFSAPSFARALSIPQYLISPSIDPLSLKNKELSASTISRIVERFGIDMSRPVLTQISRFDYLKDPLGVIEVYKMVKQYRDVQLVLAGGGATDDPEGMEVLQKVKDAAHEDSDIHVIHLPPSSDVEINALQRASTIILQKSLREGFGLTVAEALWKEKPVIASAVGGIPLQIKHNHSGMLAHSIEGTAYYVKLLLNDPELCRFLGKNGREHIKANFLITRHIHNYLLLFLSLSYEGGICYV
jgi:trehalose synthase